MGTTAKENTETRSVIHMHQNLWPLTPRAQIEVSNIYHWKETELMEEVIIDLRQELYKMSLVHLARAESKKATKDSQDCVKRTQ